MKSIIDTVQDEMLDIYDENMKHIGTMGKQEVHSKKHWHCCAQVWITDGKNVLVQLRAPEKIQYPNLWDISLAGHFSAGETALQGAKREYEEEFGAKWNFGNIKEDCIIKVATMQDGTTWNEFTYIYFLKAKIDLSKLKLQKEEVANIKYIPYKEFLALFNSKDFVPHPEHYKQAIVTGLSRHIS